MPINHAAFVRRSVKLPARVKRRTNRSAAILLSANTPFRQRVIRNGRWYTRKIKHRIDSNAPSKVE